MGEATLRHREPKTAVSASDAGRRRRGCAAGGEGETKKNRDRLRRDCATLGDGRRDEGRKKICPVRQTLLSLQIEKGREPTGRPPFRKRPHSSSGLGHRPLTAKIRGSNPRCGTRIFCNFFIWQAIESLPVFLSCRLSVVADEGAGKDVCTNFRLTQSALQTKKGGRDTSRANFLL